jgi:hypothetical protein
MPPLVGRLATAWKTSRSSELQLARQRDAKKIQRTAPSHKPSTATLHIQQPTIDTAPFAFLLADLLLAISRHFAAAVGRKKEPQEPQVPRS